MADIDIDNRHSSNMVRLSTGSAAQSTDENMSNASDIDSEKSDDEEIPTDKMDPEDREIYEKLKLQEQHERLEIERELKAHKDALARQQEFEELRAKELRMHADRLQQARIERLTRTVHY